MTTDNETHDLIENELGKNAPWQQKLNRALELGATVTVIERITSVEVKGGLPWINHLLQAGWSNEQVKNLLLAHCQHEYFGSEFQYAFAKNYDVWKLFDQPQELAEFLQKLPDESSMSAKQIVIQWDDHYDELMARLGARQLYTVVEKAVRHLARPEDPRVVTALQNMERPLQRQAAIRLYPNWNTIPFIVKVFRINDCEDWRDRIEWYAERLMPHENWPMQTPSALRWALLGGLRMPNENGWHQEGDPGIQLKRAVEARGWRFAKLEQITDPQTGEEALGVTDKNTHGQTTIYVHDNNGARGDRLKAGDEVLVPKDPAKSLTNGRQIHGMETLQPIRKDGKTRVFKFELHPVAPPTAVMLEKPAFYFRGDDIVPPK